MDRAVRRKLGLRPNGPVLGLLGLAALGVDEAPMPPARSGAGAPPPTVAAP